MKPPAPQADHLVIAAPTLDAGVRWCEQKLGITPGPGGEHTLMGTHNRLALLASDAFERVYLEIIAINPQATPSKPEHHARWFGLDDASLQQRLQAQGPALIHWVARVGDLPQALAACRQAGVDLGAAVSASRMTAQGLLSWSISIRADGKLPADGVMPTLIGWGETHPAQSMAPSALRLKSLHCRHPRAAELNRLWQALGGAATWFETGAAGLGAVLQTPRGEVRLGAQ